MYKFLSEHKFAPLWDKCPGVQLLSSMTVTCLALQKTVSWFSRVAVLFDFPISYRLIPLLCIFANIWCCYYNLAILVGAPLYLLEF